MERKSKKKTIFKWISFSLAILLNGFIVFYSCVDEQTTVRWNWSLTKALTNLINLFTNKEVESIPVTGINAFLSNEEGYQYNYLPGYKVDEIPLGSAKQIECTVAPENATNKAITYSANPADAVSFNQSSSTLSVVGMKVGECVITAKSSDGGFESSVTIEVVETIAPVSYEISLDNTNIAIGTTQTIDFDIDGGVLTHDELINFRYYDIRKLSYSSLDDTIATVDKYGVIYPHNIGTTTITVSNGDYSKSINVSVTSGSTPTPYTNLSISGSNVCYANDMILDQNSKKNHYQLTPKDGETELDPEDFIWSSSNELLVKVDKHGVMRGFRKTTTDDETVVITAKSKLTGQEANLSVTLKEQLPTEMYYWFSVGDRTVWTTSEYTLAVGDNISLHIGYRPYNIQNKNVVVESSNKELIDITNEGDTVTLHVLKEGTCVITIKSLINSDLVLTTKFNIVKAGSIGSDQVETFGTYLRKSLGHAAVFMVSQVFTLLTFFMFFIERKWYIYTSMSLGEGLFISILSEMIQHFVPTRTGAFTDVLINFAGVVVGAGLTLLGIYLVKLIKTKKQAKLEKEGKENG